MKKPTNATESRFVDEENGFIDPLPIFVTRTTLQAILHKREVKTLSDLGTHLNASNTGEPMASNKTVNE